jgi:hypothetical protein
MAKLRGAKPFGANPESPGRNPAARRLEMNKKLFIIEKPTTVEVSPDGADFSMNFLCRDGGEISLNLPTECLNWLAIISPQLNRQALRAKYHDNSLRLVYPTDNVRIERSSDPKAVIATLITAEGYEVSFGLTSQQLTVFRTAADIIDRDAAENGTVHFN